MVELPYEVSKRLLGSGTREMKRSLRNIYSSIFVALVVAVCPVSLATNLFAKETYFNTVPTDNAAPIGSPCRLTECVRLSWGMDIIGDEKPDKPIKEPRPLKSDSIDVKPDSGTKAVAPPPAPPQPPAAVPDNGSVGQTTFVGFDKSPGVFIPQKIVAKIEALAKAYTEMSNQDAGNADGVGPMLEKRLFVTSGRRSAQEQANAMLVRFELNGSSAYPGPKGQEVYSAYSEGVNQKEGKDAIAKRMTDVLEAQEKAGNPLSEHQKDNAIDFGVKGRMTFKDIQRLINISDKNTVIKIEFAPIHLHVEFKD